MAKGSLRLELVGKENCVKRFCFAHLAWPLQIPVRSNPLHIPIFARLLRTTQEQPNSELVSLVSLLRTQGNQGMQGLRLQSTQPFPIFLRHSGNHSLDFRSVTATEEILN